MYFKESITPKTERVITNTVSCIYCFTKSVLSLFQWMFYIGMCHISPYWYVQINWLFCSFFFCSLTQNEKPVLILFCNSTHVRRLWESLVVSRFSRISPESVWDWDLSWYFCMLVAIRPSIFWFYSSLL